MKRVILLLTFLFSSIIFPQNKYYTFSELRGMEDQSGNTHLFYRLYYNNEVPNYTDMSNNIYHLDIFNKVDTLFLPNNYYSNPAWQSGIGASNLEFWNNDPTRYIYIGTYCGIDCDGGLVRYDGQELNLGIDLPTTFGISKQNDSLIYIGTWSGESFKSIDGGKSSVKINDTVSFYSIYPYNDKVVFGDYDGNLAKSTDGGLTFILKNVHINPQSNNITQYDKDKSHIYLLNYKALLVSSDTGNSWQQKYEGTSSIYISNDDSTSGSFYLADGSNIYYSSDFGNSFSLFKKLDHDIVGIYKKPNSNKLYAATKYDLVELNDNSIRTIKSLPINPKILNYYPLALGDKWIYENTYVTIESGTFWAGKDYLIRVVTGDTVLDNNNTYFILKNKYLFQSLEYTLYERIDSSSGKIYLYNPSYNSGGNESLLFDLEMEQGDTNSVIIPFEMKKYPTIYYADSSFNKWEILSTRKFFMTTYGNITYSLADTLGVFDFSDPCCSNAYDPGADYTLTGCVINGKVYGDTTITDVKDKQNIPLQFSLSQNYPNPFNPSTTIKYEIPKETSVTIKIFDALGREVVTLLNSDQKAGQHEVNWNAKNYASGVYFYRIRAGEFISTKKMLLIK